ncbi:hypothetical protein [Neobacillus sp. PS3-40]|nr:hypothetical protein [Neobacillus sp. PS3-40]WML44102.1 hypothetical protein RCG20_20350 [Neobacillus sp. PS3-40]
MASTKKPTKSKVHIVDRVFLDKIKLEDYFRKEADLLLEKYK